MTDDIGIAYLYYTVIGKSIRKSDSNIDSKIGSAPYQEKNLKNLESQACIPNEKHYSC